MMGVMTGLGGDMNEPYEVYDDGDLMMVADRLDKDQDKLTDEEIENNLTNVEV